MGKYIYNPRGGISKSAATWIYDGGKGLIK